MALICMAVLVALALAGVGVRALLSPGRLMRADVTASDVMDEFRSEGGYSCDNGSPALGELIPESVSCGAAWAVVYRDEESLYTAGKILHRLVMGTSDGNTFTSPEMLTRLKAGTWPVWQVTCLDAECSDAARRLGWS